MFKQTSKLSLLTALTLSLAGVSACVAEDGIDDGADSADTEESAVTGTAGVRMGSNGKLEYLRDSTGDTVPDFSNAGYHGGGVPIPKVPVVKTLTATAGDSRAAIQAAIDEVAKMPRDKRGAILLKKGTYRVSGPLMIRASGIVLRGEGDGDNGTVLLSTSRKVAKSDEEKEYSTIIRLEGGGTSYGSAVKVTDKYVPVGGRTVTLASTSGLSVGDTVSVDRHSTKEWIHAIGMDQIPKRKDGKPIKQWGEGSAELHFERVITKIEGKTVTFDAPLTNSLDAKYGGGQVRKMTKDARISEVGVESLRGLGLEKVTDREAEDHVRDLVSMMNVTNAWVQNVTGARLVHTVVTVRDGSKWVTVRRSKMLEPVGPRTGGYLYAFENDDAQLVLFHGCESTDARHDYSLGSGVPGPNVFLESVRKHDLDKEGDNEMGPHQRWSTGVLFDSMNIDGGNISAYDRGNAGSGQGWSAANVVIWNSKATDGFRCERPATAHQWIFGSTGKAHTEDHANLACEIVSANKAMQPQSLYRQQLVDRLGPGALKALDD